MPFGITYDNRITFYLFGDTTALTLHPASEEQISQVKVDLTDRNAVIEMASNGCIRLLPVRAVAHAEVDQVRTARQAKVELYEDAAGKLYLRDPEETVAWPIENPKPGRFQKMEQELIEGEWEMEILDGRRGLEGLTLIATYKYGIAQVEPVFVSGEDRVPVAGELGRAFVGDYYLSEQPTLG